MAASLSDTNSSAFLRPPPAACPDDFLALAAGTAPRPMPFVRATGAATLETARDAVAAGLTRPLLVGEAGQIAEDAATIGWDLA
ncbi:MAG: hypothetical protein CMN39_02980, partial [SAR116 cluster bacterium]|nr:hypothetical protein [SAR116 cluster bacterium]